MRDRLAGVAVAFAVLVAAPPALADDEVDPSALRAEKLAEDAAALVARGLYAEAVELYTQASQASPAAVLTFDIAWLYDQHLGAKTLALAFYRRTISAPDATPELVARANERVAAIEAIEPAQRPGEPPAIAKIGPERPSSWSPTHSWALVAGGTGLVALGLGAAFAVVAKNKDDDAGRFCDGDRCTDPRALTLTDDASSAATIANVAIVSGVVFLAGGLTLWLLAPRRGSADAGARTASGLPSMFTNRGGLVW